MAKVDNGWVDDYPHDDFQHACTGPCCIPEAYPKTTHPWSCDGEGCFNELKYRGLCVSCAEKQGCLEEPVLGKIGDIL